MTTLTITDRPRLEERQHDLLFLTAGNSATASSILATLAFHPNESVALLARTNPSLKDDDYMTVCLDHIRVAQARGDEAGLRRLRHLYTLRFGGNE